MAKLHLKQYAAMNISYRFYPLEYFLDAEAEIGVKSIELHGTSPHVMLRTTIRLKKVSKAMAALFGE